MCKQPTAFLFSSDSECPNGHPLKLHTYSRGGWCDECGTDVSTCGTAMMDCRTCNWGLCTKCFSQISPNPELWGPRNVAHLIWSLQVDAATQHGMRACVRVLLSCSCQQAVQELSRGPAGDMQKFHEFYTTLGGEESDVRESSRLFPSARWHDQLILNLEADVRLRSGEPSIVVFKNSS